MDFLKKFLPAEEFHVPVFKYVVIKRNGHNVVIEVPVFPESPAKHN